MKKTEIEWNPYPKEKPKCADEYLVSINCGYFKMTSTSIWKNNKFEKYENKPGRIGSIVAWAEMPDPYEDEKYDKD